MFGHHWEPGEATVVTVHEEHDFSEWPADASARRYSVSVRPESGARAFRTEVRRSYKHREAMNPERGLVAGDVISVQCDVKHEEAKFDESDPRLYKQSQSTGDPIQALNDVAVRLGDVGQAFSSGPVADILQQVMSDPEGFKARMRAQAQTSGASVFMVTEGGMVAGGPGSAAPQIDIADQLTKLAALRDTGVLTEAEFTAQKQKLLGS